MILGRWKQATEISGHPPAGDELPDRRLNVDRVHPRSREAVPSLEEAADHGFFLVACRAHRALLAPA
jgi:hypothetical protein